MDNVNFRVNLISNLGFPIFVALYLLIYQSKLTRGLTEAIKHLTTAINVLIGKE